MRNLKVFLYMAAITVAGSAATGCIDPEGTAEADQAITGDHGMVDQGTHYNYVGLTGFNTRDFGAVFKNISNFPQLQADLTALRAQFGAGPCTTSNGCLRIMDETGAAASTLIVDDPAQRREALLTLASISLASSQSKLTLIVSSSAAAPKLVASVQRLVNSATGLSGGVIGYGAPLTDTVTQSAVTTAVSGFSGPVTAPAGAFAATQIIRVGASDYAGTSTDTTWSGSTAAADVLSVGHNIPDASGVVADSLAAPAGMILGRLANQPTAPATKAQLMAASSSHFTAVVGSTSRGIFKDGSAL